jgi:hypothetical protein
MAKSPRLSPPLRPHQWGRIRPDEALGRRWQDRSICLDLARGTIRLSCRSCGTSTDLSHTSGRRSTTLSTVSPTSTASVSSGWVRSFASAPAPRPPGWNHRWSMPPLWPRPCGGGVRAIGTGPHESPAWCAPASVAARRRGSRAAAGGPCWGGADDAHWVSDRPACGCAQPGS